MRLRKLSFIYLLDLARSLFETAEETEAYVEQQLHKRKALLMGNLDLTSTLHKRSKSNIHHEEKPKNPEKTKRNLFNSQVQLLGSSLFSLLPRSSSKSKTDEKKNRRATISAPINLSFLPRSGTFSNEAGVSNTSGKKMSFNSVRDAIRIHYLYLIVLATLNSARGSYIMRMKQIHGSMWAEPDYETTVKSVEEKQKAIVADIKYLDEISGNKLFLFWRDEVKIPNVNNLGLSPNRTLGLRGLNPYLWQVDIEDDFLPLEWTHEVIRLLHAESTITTTKGDDQLDIPRKLFETAEETAVYVEQLRKQAESKRHVGQKAHRSQRQYSKTRENKPLGPTPSPYTSN